MQKSVINRMKLVKLNYNLLKLTTGNRFKIPTNNMEDVLIHSATTDQSQIVEKPPSSPGKFGSFVGITPLKNQFKEIKTPTHRPFRVSIEGNIGAGKSTLIEYFKNEPGIETYPEPIDWWRDVDGHNLLELLYSDIDKWINCFQSYVQLSRLKVQTSKPPSSSTTVQMFERSIQNNRFCFLEQAYRRGSLHSADYAVLDEWYRWVRANADIDLDLIVYLRSSPEVVYERMKARGRPEELGVSFDYLKDLHDSHERWLMSNDERFNTIKVLELDANKTLDDIVLQYKSHENKILGYDRKGIKRVDRSETDKVKKVLKLDMN